MLVAHRTLGGRSKRGHHKAHQRSTTKIHVVGSIQSNGEALEQTVKEALEQRSLFLYKGFLASVVFFIGRWFLDDM